MVLSLVDMDVPPWAYAGLAATSTAAAPIAPMRPLNMVLMIMLYPDILGFQLDRVALRLPRVFS
jgi:hypothetical protein